jgi:hypothetical protein
MEDLPFWIIFIIIGKNAAEEPHYSLQMGSYS